MSRLNEIIREMKNSHSVVEFASEQQADAYEMHNKNGGVPVSMQKMLPLAASEYQISSDIKDYVVVPVILLPTDIPNRNSVAFPLEELLKFNVIHGMPNYKTWVGKPTFEEHANNDHTAAKGIIFDTYLQPISNTVGNIHKLIALCGFDRTKDRELANAILKGDRKSYSMGAMVKTYECAICGALSKPRKLNTECGHVVRGMPKLFEDNEGRNIPSYLIARNEIVGIEASSVATPAWSSATNSSLFDMSDF
jgi:hypothetical protein